MIQLDHRSTKAIQEDKSLKLHFREESDICGLIKYVLQEPGCIYSGCRGLLYQSFEPAQMAAEMLRVQEMYKKCSGVRIRHDFVIISKDELSPECGEFEIRQIADQFANVYYWSGFQVAFGVFMEPEQYCIRYAINTVDYHSGAKYQGGAAMWGELERLLEAIVRNVTGAGQGVDCGGLEYYPY